MNLFENTIFINLEKRKDRLKHVLNEFKKLNIKGERFNAIQSRYGAIGCSLSHIECLEIAKKRKYKHVFICEDDITFLNPKLLLYNLNKFINNKKIHWDVLLLGGNNNFPYVKINDYCCKISNCLSAMAYIVKEEYYDTLLKNLKDGVNYLINEPFNSSFALDVYWKKLQFKDSWYLLTPLTVIQYENYSDIENKNKNYKDLLLNMDNQISNNQKKIFNFSFSIGNQIQNNKKRFNLGFSS